VGLVRQATCGRMRQTQNPKKERSDYYALHFSCSFARIVAPGISEFLHYGRFHSHSTGACGCGYSA
jgi:hypothetical protein